MIAIRKRIATKEIGGRSRSPTLIASQVELQTMQRGSHAAGIRQPMRCIRRDTRADRQCRKGTALGLWRRKSALAADTGKLTKPSNRKSMCSTRSEYRVGKT